MFNYTVEVLQFDPPDLLSSSGGVVLYFTQRGARCRCEGGPPFKHLVQSFLASDLLILRLEEDAGPSLRGTVDARPADSYSFDPSQLAGEGVVVVGGPSREVGACWVTLREGDSGGEKLKSPALRTSPARAYVLWEVAPLVLRDPLLAGRKSEVNFANRSAIGEGEEGVPPFNSAPISSPSGIDCQVERTPAQGSRASPPAISSKNEVGKPEEGEEDPSCGQNSLGREIPEKEKVEPPASGLAQPIAGAPSISPLKPFLLEVKMRADGMPRPLKSPPPQCSYPTRPEEKGRGEGPHPEGVLKEKNGPWELDSTQIENAARGSSPLDPITSNTKEDSGGGGKPTLQSSELRKEDSNAREAGSANINTMDSNYSIEKTDRIPSGGGGKASSGNASVSTFRASEVNAFDDKEIVSYDAQREDRKVDYSNLSNLNDEGRGRTLDYFAMSTQGLPPSMAYLNIYLAPPPSLIAMQADPLGFVDPNRNDDTFGLNSTRWDGSTKFAGGFPLQWLDHSALASIRRERQAKEVELMGQDEGSLSQYRNPGKETIPGENRERYGGFDYSHQNREAMISRHKFDVFCATERKRVPFSKTQ